MGVPLSTSRCSFSWYSAAAVGSAPRTARTTVKVLTDQLLAQGKGAWRAASTCRFTREYVSACSCDIP
jgi:hypothetical protein